MSIEFAQLVFSGFSALSSLIQAYNSTKEEEIESRSSDVWYHKFSRTTGTVRREKPSFIKNEADNSIAVLNKVIDDDILSVISKNIDSALKRLKDALNDHANSNQTKDNEIDIANSIICAELKRIMKLNNGNLPSKYFERIWLSHGCIT